jgi:hypothetical protein
VGAEHFQGKLIQDVDGATVQTLRIDETAIASASITGSTATTILPASTLPSPSPLEVYEVTPTMACRFATGTAGVTATNGRALNAGSYVYRLPAGHTHFAVVAIGSVTGSPIITVSRLY